MNSSPRFFNELAERTEKVIFSYNLLSNRFDYINPAFEELFQISREGIMAAPAFLADIIHSEDKDYVIERYSKLVEEGIRKSLEFRVLLPDKTVRWICLNPFKIEEEPDLNIISGFIEDITTGKNNEAVTKKFAAKKDSVLEILSHDLTGPLTSINGLTNYLSKKTTHLNDPDLDQIIKLIADTSERSIRLIREFVKQEFLESSHAGLIRKRVDLVEKIKDIIEQYKLSQRNIRKVFELHSSNEKVFIELDDYKFSQVINNLISNAIKFTHDDGLIAVFIEEKEDTVTITVKDNGIGIPAKHQEELFEKFTKARRPGIKGEPSVGLGMSIIKTIIDWHEGNIWFESTEGKGTTFYIELPRKKE